MYTVTRYFVVQLAAHDGVAFCRGLIFSCTAVDRAHPILLRASLLRRSGKLKNHVLACYRTLAKIDREAAAADD